MNHLDPCQAAYLAGLIDADGTITLSRRHRNETRHAAVSISNTDRSLLEFVRRTVGAGKITNKRAVSSRHRPSYAFAITNRQAIRLLGDIEPFLRTYKADRARLMIRDYVALTPRNGRYTPEQKRARRRFELAVLGVRPAKTVCRARPGKGKN
ncbi:MAG: LAGLIDADG family homing endonuclease [Gammaproteobacteria bacterium]